MISRDVVRKKNLENLRKSFLTDDILVFLNCAYSLYFNSQAPDQKSNPQAPDRTCTSISVKTPSQTFEIATSVFAGAENH